MRFKVAFSAIAFLTVTAVIVFFVRGKRTPISAELLRCLRGRGTVVVRWEGDFDYKAISGVNLRPIAELPSVAKALAGQDSDALRRALDSAKADGILVSARFSSQSNRKVSLAESLSTYRHVPGLRGLCLDPAAVLYIADPPPQLSSGSEVALTTVTRALLRGAEAPQVGFFPEPLRRLRTSEVMVTLFQGNSPRLWRSARGSSIARALITATTVARNRWNERERSMGGSLDDRLPRMDIEVSLLVDDGTLLARAPAFFNRVISAIHGIGYEHKATWQYLLPEATFRKGQGSAAEAFQRLLKDEGVESRDLHGSDLRLYRFVVVKLARSRPLNK